MVARPKKLTSSAVIVAVLLACAVALPRLPAQEKPVTTSATRIVSLVPASTEMLFAIGAGNQVVGVSNFDEFPVEAKSLPRVGALLDPDTERILALKPDLVVIYGSQLELAAQFARAGIRAFSYRHGGLTDLIQTIRDLGGATGHTDEATAVVRDIQRQLEAVRAKVRGRARPRTLLVFGREPLTLRQLYASGGSGFLHEMLGIAGGVNVFADVPRESVQPSTETLLARAPEAILEVRANPLSPDVLRQEREVWSVLPSIPAVRARRIHFLTGDYLVVPGPRVGRATEAFAKALHPEVFQ